MLLRRYERARSEDVFAMRNTTDALARLSGQSSEIGAWLDPMADKLLLVSTFVVLTWPGLGLTNRLPVWLTVLIISRDVVIVSVVAIVNLAIGHRTFSPSIWGKLATASYIVLVVVIMYFNWRRQPSLLVESTVWISLMLTLLSSADYLIRVRRLVNHDQRTS